MTGIAFTIYLSAVALIVYSFLNLFFTNKKLNAKVLSLEKDLQDQLLFLEDSKAKNILIKRMKFVNEIHSAKKIVSEIRTDDSYIIEIDLIDSNGQKNTMKAHAGIIYQYITFSLNYASRKDFRYYYDANGNLYPLEFAKEIAEFTKKQLIPSIKTPEEIVELFEIEKHQKIKYNNDKYNAQ